MCNEERYEKFDLPFYKQEIAPILPDEVLDFHTHIWREDQWLGLNKNSEHNSKHNKEGINSASATKSEYAKYMVTQVNYTVEQLMNDGKRMFPDRRYNAVVFGQPTPSADTNLTNSYVVDSARSRDELFPLLVTGKDMFSKEELKQKIRDGKCYGYKVFLNWIGNDYGNIKIQDMIGKNEMELANEFSLIVLLHVPRSRRLADPEVQKGVREYAKSYPQAKIVLAHCGRCYHPDEISAAIEAIKGLENVYMDTSMVMEPLVMQMIFNNIDSSRIMYATDFPVAVMRGRRVYVMDHWVDVVLEGYEESDFRAASNRINATFMAYEIALAIKRAADIVGLSTKEVKNIFYDNGMNLLKGIKNI